MKTIKLILCLSLCYVIAYSQIQKKVIDNSDREISSIKLNHKVIQKSSKFISLSVSDTLFLPDSVIVSYILAVNSFPLGLSLTNISEFLGVCLVIEHSYLADLDISLTCPDGSTVFLKQDGSGGATFLGEPVSVGCPDSETSNSVPGTGYEYCWTSNPLHGTMGSEGGMYNYTYTDLNGNIHTAQSYLPEGSYTYYLPPSNLIGCPLNGDWKINISDNLGLDNGYIFGLSLSFSVNTGVSHLITGKVFADTNGDCVFNGSDFPQQSILLEFQPGPYYAITDTNGNYSAWVDTGTYTLNQILPNALWNQLCPDLPDYYTITVTPPFGDTISGLDFANEADFYCPDLSVDISASSLRACMYNYYYVQYCNNGTAPSINSTIEIELDNDMTYLSTNGNKL